MNEVEINRLRWRCRRGMLELDAWLNGFLDRCYPDLAAQDRARFARFLEHEDPDLFAWLSGYAAAPAEFEALVAQIRNCMVKTR